MSDILKIENLKVAVGENEILHGVNLRIGEGETHLLLGPNGSGKTTLLMSLMGFPRYVVTAGRIFFKGKDVTSLPINERAALGMGMSFQRPPTIRGVKTRQIAEIAGKGKAKVDELAALAAKRTEGITCEWSFLTASRALHIHGHSPNNGA